MNQEQRLTISRLDEKSLDAIYLDVFLLAGYCHTVVLLKNESAVRSCASNFHVLPNKELEAARTCLNRRLVNLTVDGPGVEGSPLASRYPIRNTFSCYCASANVRAARRRSVTTQKSFLLTAFPPFYRNGYVTKRRL